MPLTAKQSRFVEEYTVDFNGAAAAVRAGYSKKTAKEIACENLTKPHIAEAIKKRVDALSMSADEALIRLGEIARADLRPFYEERTIERDGETFKVMALNLATEEAQKNFHLIKAIVPTQSGRKIVLHDAQAALIDILKMHGKLGPKGTEEDPHHHVLRDIQDWREGAKNRIKDAEATLGELGDE